MPVFTITLGANKPIRVIGSSKNRIAVSLFNDSNNDVFFGFSPGVAVSGNQKGVKIGKYGGSFQEKDHKGDIWLITGTESEITIEDVVSNEQG